MRFQVQAQVPNTILSNMKQSLLEHETLTNFQSFSLLLVYPKKKPLSAFLCTDSYVVKKSTSLCFLSVSFCSLCTSHVSCLALKCLPNDLMQMSISDNKTCYTYSLGYLFISYQITAECIVLWLHNEIGWRDWPWVVIMQETGRINIFPLKCIYFVTVAEVIWDFKAVLCLQPCTLFCRLKRKS